MQNNTLGLRHSYTCRQLYAPTDLDNAYSTHRINCGPAAFSALVGAPLSEVLECFPQFPSRPWTSAKQMIEALDNYGLAYATENKWPHCGLVLLQFTGPWGDARSKAGATLKRTHWLAAKDSYVYDINWQGWLTMDLWQKLVLPDFMDFEPSISGWECRLAIEVALPQGTQVTTEFTLAR